MKYLGNVCAEWKSLKKFAVFYVTGLAKHKSGRGVHGIDCCQPDLPTGDDSSCSASNRRQASAF